MKDAMLALGEEDIAVALRAAGVRAGDGLFVHTALGQIGYVIGGPRGLIQGLIDAVGPDGLIGMTGFSDDAYDPVEMHALDVDADMHARIKRQVPGFDPVLSNVRQNGAVPEAFRSWPGVARSSHPTSSVLLFGPEAEDFSQHHDPRSWPTGPNTPWGRLRSRRQMKVLLIGVGWNRCSALHAAESAANYKRTIVRNIKIGTGPDASWIKAPDVSDDMGRLFPLVGAAWEETGNVQRGMIGSAVTLLTDYAALLDFASEWISARNKIDGVPLTMSDQIGW